MQREVKITSIPLSDTTIPNKYNSSNHHALDFTYGRVLSEEEYIKIRSKSARHTWSHLQPTEGKVLEYTFTPGQTRTLLDASKSGVISGRRPAAYEEELQEIEAKLPHMLNKSYFTRLSECSTKDSVVGCGPFTRPSQVIDALVTSERCMKGYEKDKTNTLYLVPWREDWHDSTCIEFRVFCYHGKVNAISQYNWLHDVGLARFAENDCADIRKACSSIVIFCEGDIIPNLTNDTEGNWTIDVVYNFKKQLSELVEVNSFGCELAAGSGLFHWVTNRDVIYGRTPFVEFRYTVP